jgi:hypothetical protein
MVPARDVVKAENGEGGSGKTDYRNLWRVGWFVHKVAILPARSETKRPAARESTPSERVSVSRF